MDIGAVMSPMPRALPIDERLERAAQIVIRCRIFYDIWIYFEGQNTHPAIDDERFSEFFRFDPHAHFVAFVVHIAALFEKRKDTINFRRLVKEMEQAGLISVQNAAEVDALLTRAQPFASKVTILRSNLFAHRSATLSYADAFKKAAVTAKQLCYLTNVALKIANRLLIVRGRNDQFFNALPANHADAILRVLSRSPAEGSKSKRSAQILKSKGGAHRRQGNRSR
jgi:AbiU2